MSRTRSTATTRTARGKPGYLRALHPHALGQPERLHPSPMGSRPTAKRCGRRQAELLPHGRINVPNFIVFLTDGEANIGSVYSKSDAKFPQGGATTRSRARRASTQPPRSRRRVRRSTASATRSAARTAPAECSSRKEPAPTPSTTSPALTGTTGCFHFGSTNGNDLESPAITSHDAVERIASLGHFKSTATASELTTIFASIASDIASGSSRLVDDGF